MTSLTVQPGQPAPAQHDRTVPPATRRSGFAGTLRSEFTKLRSLRSTHFTLIAFFLAGIGFAVIAAAGNRANGGHAGFDATAMSLHGVVNVGELIIVVIGALVITSEYGTRMISTSLTAMPRRGVLYAAKVVVLACVTFAVALVMAFASFFAGQAVLGTSHGGASIASPDALRSVLLCRGVRDLLRAARVRPRGRRPVHGGRGHHPVRAGLRDSPARPGPADKLVPGRRPVAARRART